jgi:fido (protein-threonine AMPylation protein)
MEAFEDIDPQHPLGGPDGGKDILCTKDGNTFVGAVHFTRKAIKLSETTKKFTSDLEASLKHSRSGFVFLTNQDLTVGERTQLEKIAASKGKRCLIYHRERLRVMLDSPAGYGLRLRHLHVPMSNEEQAAFFAASGQSFTDAIKAQTRAIDTLARRIDRFGRQGQEMFLKTVAVVANAVRHEHTDVQAMLEAAAATSFQRAVEYPKEAVSAQITPSLLRYVHRLIGPTDPTFAGKFRETQVWLVDQNGKPSPGPECPAWDKVPSLINELLDDWNRDYGTLVEDKGKVIPAIAKFFELLVWIHPFIDGNSRLARAIFALQARELLGLLEDPILDRGAPYYLALQEADSGKFGLLEGLILAAIEHAG